MKIVRRRIGGVLGTLRAAYRQLNNRYFGTLERFEGDAREVCQQIVDRLWYDDFYRTSLGHYDFFWMRDFGTVAESLTKIGEKKKVHHTLKWALRHYRRAGDLTLCIDKYGHTFNAPAKQSIDAIPWLLHSLAVSEYPLNKSEHVFLQQQIRKYTKKYLHEDSGLIKKVHYAELRDAVLYDRSAYSLALVGRMAVAAKQLRLTAFTYDVSVYSNELVDHYWTGEYFKADRVSDAYSSECALMPFFLKVVNDQHKAEETFDYIQRKKLNKPYPLKYSDGKSKFHYRFGMGPFQMPNYTGDSIWTWHATFYLHLLDRYNRPEYSDEYKSFSSLIERHGSYPELVNADGSWYYAPFYRSDPGMVWAALFLELPKR